MVYQRGNQRDGSPHYVFLYSDDENSGDEETISLQQCNKSLPRKVEVIYVPLKSEDTLQALALRYRCTRINKIHKENEIHARRFIKVPIQPFSLLTETLEHDQKNNQLDRREVSISTPDEKTENIVMADPLLNVIKNPVVIELPKAEINTIILNSVCEPLSSYNNSNSLEIINSECDQLLTSTENNTKNPHLTETFRCSGDDCGLSWTQLLGFSLLLGFAGPIIYILYIIEFSSKNHLVNNH
ncbi:lysM and putative peptidoglycan-binding domain-containing protein 3 isoform X2 [Apis laboriosa]|uniref:lysM and putative peptidoglycan-binding domain-containing protein 3 isoform X2 n=1 Tax=Apis laboriosa TaxID=183418 RepID=UPI001CC339CB|nr:lysM and putative peptidoglycan-binding domain-containing protein 3 isoform X2 [Apis laboriosa]